MPSLGINFEDPYLLAVLYSKGKRKPPRLVFHKFLRTNVKPFYFPDLDNIVTALSSREVMVRELSLKIKKKATIRSLLPLQAEELFPFEKDQTILYPVVYPQKKKETKVTLFATTFDYLQHHLDHYQSCEIDPDIVSASASALARFARTFVPDHKDLLILHVTQEQTSWILLKDKIIAAALSFPFCEGELYEKELEKLVGFIAAKGLTLPPCLATGSISEAHRALIEKICGPSVPLALPPNLQIDEPANLSRFALPVGLALEGESQDKEALQFRQKNFLSKRMQKRAWRLPLRFALCSVGIAAALLFSDLWLTHAKERPMQQKITALLQKDLPLSEGIKALEEQAAAESSAATLCTTAPKVSDLLEWMGRHPQLNATDKKSHIEVTKVSYFLERHPKLGEKKGSALAAVEIEIATSSPHLARSFHQALLKGDGLVNEKKTITWKGEKNRYTTKFYLRS